MYKSSAVRDYNSTGSADLESGEYTLPWQILTNGLRDGGQQNTSYCVADESWNDLGTLSDRLVSPKVKTTVQMGATYKNYG